MTYDKVKCKNYVTSIIHICEKYPLVNILFKVHKYIENKKKNLLQEH